MVKYFPFLILTVIEQVNTYIRHHSTCSADKAAPGRGEKVAMSVVYTELVLVLIPGSARF